MTSYKQILQIEKEIANLQNKLASLKSETVKVKHGDLVIITRDYEWVCDKGTVMMVDTVSEGHIHAVHPDPKLRMGRYWISNGDFIKK
jgi:translation initiation factor IF-1